MKYAKYKNLIMHWAKALAFVKRYRIIILSVFLGITATVSTLLATNGGFIGGVQSPNEVVYGEAYEFKTNAFMAQTHNQYYDEELGVWVDGLPSDPGTYQLRAYAITAFNKVRYSDVATIRIREKEITFYLFPK